MFWGRTFTPDTDIPDLTGKVILVTGGNTGLGAETVLQLAKHNPAQIYLAARTPSKAENAIAEIKHAVPSTRITFLNLDLTSFSSVAEAARSFSTQSKRLDILINNAGIMGTPPGTTRDGYEIQFGTNHIGHALLTKLLIPTMLSTAKMPGADVRIVNLSSEGHKLAPGGGIITDKAKLEALGPWVRYGHSKLANILFTRELGARYPDITSIAVHPGVIKTDLYKPGKETNVLLRWGMLVLGPFMMGTVQEGAKNQLWAATTKRDGLRSGAYYTPIGSLSKGSGYAQDKIFAGKLWDWTQSELATKGFG